MTDSLAHGIYEKLLHRSLEEILHQHPELRSVFGKLDVEEQPSRYAAFVARVLEKALREVGDPDTRLDICNRIIGLISQGPGLEHHSGQCLVPSNDPVLLEISPPRMFADKLPRPETPIAETALFTGSPGDPPLAGELSSEMASADGVDMLVSFIKWSGLRLLMTALEDLRDRGCLFD